MNNALSSTTLDELLTNDVLLDQHPAVVRLLSELRRHPALAALPVAATPNPSAERRVLLDIHLNGKHYVLTCAESPLPTQSTILSPREREIVHLVAKGLPNKAIAEVLEISQWTVATHLKRIFAKLAVSSRAEMVAYVVKTGL
jgi:DNA-binding CsgD family transcriptional regulator